MLSSNNKPTIISSLITNNQYDGFFNYTRISLFIIVLLIFLGFGIMLILGNNFEDFLTNLQNYFLNTFDLLGDSAGMIINKSADIGSDAAKVGIDIVEDSLHNVGNLMAGENGYNGNTISNTVTYNGNSISESTSIPDIPGVEIPEVEIPEVESTEVETESFVENYTPSEFQPTKKKGVFNKKAFEQRSFRGNPTKGSFEKGAFGGNRNQTKPPYGTTIPPKFNGLSKNSTNDNNIKQNRKMFRNIVPEWTKTNSYYDPNITSGTPSSITKALPKRRVNLMKKSNGTPSSITKALPNRRVNLMENSNGTPSSITKALNKKGNTYSNSSNVQPDTSDGILQKPIASGKNNWCLIGEYQKKRGCISVLEDDICMSGQLFPSKEMCLNPTNKDF
jgi:hypothetical protein